MKNQLYYGDNLDVLRKSIKDESIDLCYIDPPFNSKRDYNLLYNKPEQKDVAQSEAFVDTWRWDCIAERGYEELIDNPRRLYSLQTIELIRGLRRVLGEIDLMAYLVSMTLRIAEIHRALKPTGSFYLHCDPTASHYLKLVLDTVFLNLSDGVFLNEIVWCYNVGGKSKKYFARKHDIIFWYAKGKNYFFDGSLAGLQRQTGSKSFGGIITTDQHGNKIQRKLDRKTGKYYEYNLDEPKIPEDWWTDINSLQSQSRERLGYSTQKPEALLERIIKTSSGEGSVILDAYCRCGTTVVAAQRLKRHWIGIDITYQAIALILERLDNSFAGDISDSVTLSGIPRDYDSAVALANKKDDRTRKEFEKWAILTYSNNKAIINTKKGADSGIDGRAYGKDRENKETVYIFSVKSGAVGARDIRDLCGVVGREDAIAGIYITLKPPTKPMITEAAKAGFYTDLGGDKKPKIRIVTIQQILNGERMETMGVTEVHKKARYASDETEQLALI